MHKIAGLLFGDLQSRLEKQGIKLSVHPDVVDKVVREGYDRTLGARPLRRCIMLEVEDPLSDAILAGQVGLAL